MTTLKEFTRRRKLKRYQSAMHNLHENVTGGRSKPSEARALRRLFYRKTHLKIFEEKTYKKNIQSGKLPSLKDVIHAHTLIKKKHKQALNRVYEKLPEKRKAQFKNKRNFMKANKKSLDKIGAWDNIQEMYNSPD